MSFPIGACYCAVGLCDDNNSSSESGVSLFAATVEHYAVTRHSFGAVLDNIREKECDSRECQ